MARASILWLMGEYCERVPKIAPDVLRKMAKTFTAEEDIVKLQTVNLAAKLYLTNSKQVGKRTSNNPVPAGWNWTTSKYCAGLTQQNSEGLYTADTRKEASAAVCGASRTNITEGESHASNKLKF